MSETYENGIRKPSSLLDDVIVGRTDLDMADESTQSWFRLWLYQRADAILGIRSVDARRDALAKEPAIHRARIEAEARRLFEIRKERA